MHMTARINNHFCYEAFFTCCLYITQLMSLPYTYCSFHRLLFVCVAWVYSYICTLLSHDQLYIYHSPYRTCVGACVCVYVYVCLCVCVCACVLCSLQAEFTCTQPSSLVSMPATSCTCNTSHQ